MDRTEIIRKICGFEDTSKDSLIETMAELYEVSIKKTLKEEYVRSSYTGPYIDTAIYEIIGGKVLNCVKRTKGDTDVSLSSFSYKNSPADGTKLIEEGYKKLNPYLKDVASYLLLTSAEKSYF